MGKINYNRLLLGGIVAGALFILLDFLGYMLFMDSGMDEWLARHSLHEPPMWTIYLTDIALGLLAVWLYVAIRPRFGAGWKTAAIAAAFIWLLSGFLYFGFHMMGLYTINDYTMMAVWGVVHVFVPTLAGAWVYREEGETARV